MNELCSGCIHFQVCIYREKLVEFDFELGKMSMAENPISYNCNIFSTYNDISESGKEIGFK